MNPHPPKMYKNVHQPNLTYLLPCATFIASNLTFVATNLSYHALRCH